DVAVAGVRAGRCGVGSAGGGGPAGRAAGAGSCRAGGVRPAGADPVGSSAAGGGLSGVEDGAGREHGDQGTGAVPAGPGDGARLADAAFNLATEYLMATKTIRPGVLVLAKMIASARTGASALTWEQVAHLLTEQVAHLLTEQVRRDLDRLQVRAA